MAVSAEPQDIEKMRARSGATFPLYADPDRSAIDTWGVRDTRNDFSLPATFVIDATGKVVFRYVGEDKSDRPLLDNILDTLRQL